MARDAAGAEWGRYHRNKNKPSLRALVVPCVYLMYRVRGGLLWFGEHRTEVKVGRTSRSPRLRLDAISSDGFELYAYWPRPVHALHELETELLSAMRHHYGPPSMRREYFFVPDVRHAHRVAAEVVGDWGKTHTPELYKGRY